MTSQPREPFLRDRPTQRSKPRQARAQDTLSRIKRAMLEIVASEGYSSASTNRIAAQADVNIASLYRYFPNREAIALALFEEASAALARRVHDHLLESVRLPLETGIFKLVDMLVGLMDDEQLTLLRLKDDVPELAERARSLSLENLSWQAGRLYMQHHLPELSLADLDCKLFFVQRLGMALLRSYVIEKPPTLSRKRFVRELADLIVLYLRAPMATSTGKR